MKVTITNVGTAAQDVRYLNGSGAAVSSTITVGAHVELDQEMLLETEADLSQKHLILQGGGDSVAVNEAPAPAATPSKPATTAAATVPPPQASKPATVVAPAVAPQAKKDVFTPVDIKADEA
jgi:hypothetical protein